MVTWKISSLPNFADENEVFKTFRSAFRLWEKHASIAFKFTLDAADIDIFFMADEHGDRMPFAARDNAHAFYPDQGGNIHLRADVQWAFDRPPGEFRAPIQTSLPFKSYSRILSIKRPL